MYDAQFINAAPTPKWQSGWDGPNILQSPLWTGSFHKDSFILACHPHPGRHLFNISEWSTVSQPWSLHWCLARCFGLLYISLSRPSMKMLPMALIPAQLFSHSGPLCMWPPLLKGCSGSMRGVVSHQGDTHTKMWERAPGFYSLITGGIAGQRGHITGEHCTTKTRRRRALSKEEVPL